MTAGITHLIINSPYDGAMKFWQYHRHESSLVASSPNRIRSHRRFARREDVLLGRDWLETRKACLKQGACVPPVMISVANRTETAARIKNAFNKGKILIEELCDLKWTLHIDSKVLTEAESREEEEDIVSPQAEDEEHGSIPRFR